METHPIPQNVTSFQFHLVGDMTLKQFIYLAIGASIAYVNFVFLSPIAPVIAWPIIVFSAGFGAAFAFLPIQDRPLDYWIAAYFRSVYSPTNRTWAKNGKISQGDPLFPNRLNLYMGTPAAPPQQQSLTKDELSKTVELAKQAQNLQTQIVQTQKQLNAINTTTSAPEQSSQKINSILTDLTKLSIEASQIKQELAEVTHEEPTARVAARVQVVTLPKARPSQIVLTSTPNVINGIIVDATGNYLDSVVVVIYNKDGLPVRALKTNKLGQFSGATPLPNGKYTLQLEKDSLVFDVLQIELDGKVLAPINIAAKKQI